MGTLYVDTSQLTLGDEKQVFVDPELESTLFGGSASLIAFGVNQEPIAGSAVITVVPEPTTAWLFLAPGGVAAFWWRRKSDA